MGNTPSPSNPEQKYSFFHVYEDPHFGPCNIYQNNHQSNSFVLSLNILLSHDDLSTIDRKLQSFISSEKSRQKSPFLRLLDFRLEGNQKNICNNAISTCQMPSVTLQIEFLRHNLKNFLQWRKTQHKPLSVDELTMALLKAIKAYQMTKNNQILGLTLNLEDISVSIQGQMKFHPLLGKQFFRKTLKLQNRGYKSCQTSPLRERILNKRAFRQQKQNIKPKISFIKKKHNYYFPPILSKDSQFLVELNKFAQQMIIESGCILDQIRNPQESQLDEKKCMKNFLNELQRKSGLGQVKKFLGQAELDRFDVDLAKLKHEQSETKFSKILSQIEQRTDYSYHEALNQLPFKSQSLNSVQFISPQLYRYS